MPSSKSCLTITEVSPTSSAAILYVSPPLVLGSTEWWTKVYFPELLAPLLRSLIHLTVSPSDEPTIMMAYKIRSLPKECPFWSAFGLWFDWEPVLYRNRENVAEIPSVAANGQEPNSPPIPWTRYHSPSSTYLFIARRKPSSRSWPVPESDRELLEGVGANGTGSRKGDDGFELMLLMDLIDVD